jgi:uncharacterized protein (DUF1697 family)
MPAPSVYVALLRGINVGGRSTLLMAVLRRVAADCGFGSVATYIQSGNLLFTATLGADAAAARLEEAIAAEGGPTPRVAVRSRAELAAVVAGNPYVGRSTDDKQLHVAFLTQGAEQPSLDGIDLARFAPDEVTVSGRETYLFLPNGIGRSKLAEALGRLPAEATVRNWRTVTTMLSRAEAITPD